MLIPNDMENIHISSSQLKVVCFVQVSCGCGFGIWRCYSIQVGQHYTTTGRQLDKVPPVRQTVSFLQYCRHSLHNAPTLSMYLCMLSIYTKKKRHKTVFFFSDYGMSSISSSTNVVEIKYGDFCFEFLFLQSIQ